MDLKEMIEHTKNELAAAECRLDYATDGKEIEIAILKIWAAELELDRLYGLAKEGVKGGLS